MQFLPRDQVLSLEELYAVADAFIGLGVRRIRITGGEPLVRKSITGLLARLGQRAELEDLAITANGSQLRERAAELKAAGVRRLNVSLDSLQRNASPPSPVAIAWSRCWTASRRRAKPVSSGSAELRGTEGPQRRRDPQPGRVRPGQPVGHQFHRGMPLGSITSHRRELTLCTSDEVRAIIERRWSLTPSLARSGGPSPVIPDRRRAQPDRLHLTSQQ